MEESISTFCKTLGSFCNHLQTSCDSLKDSINRRPIPLESASSTFIQSLNRRVSSASADLNLLESMVIETVSFEELLGHCNEIYKKNQTDLLQLEDHLKISGYLPESGDNELDLVSEFSSPVEELDRWSDRSIDSIRKRLEDNSLLEDSVCLQDLGLSDVCLATLASQDNDELLSPKTSFQKPTSCYELSDKLHEKEEENQLPSKSVLNIARAMDESHLDSQGQLNGGYESVGGGDGPIIKTRKDDYDKLPSYLRSLASWEDLQEAVKKTNSELCKQGNQKENKSFSLEELGSMGLGKSNLLLLVRMNRLALETSNGATAYRIVGL